MPQGGDERRDWLESRQSGSVFPLPSRGMCMFCLSHQHESAFLPSRAQSSFCFHLQLREELEHAGSVEACGHGAAPVPLHGGPPSSSEKEPQSDGFRGAPEGNDSRGTTCRITA